MNEAKIETIGQKNKISGHDLTLSLWVINPTWAKGKSSLKIGRTIFSIFLGRTSNLLGFAIKLSLWIDLNSNSQVIKSKWHWYLVSYRKLM